MPASKTSNKFPNVLISFNVPNLNHFQQGSSSCNFPQTHPILTRKPPRPVCRSVCNIGCSSGFSSVCNSFAVAFARSFVAAIVAAFAASLAAAFSEALAGAIAAATFAAALAAAFAAPIEQRLQQRWQQRFSEAFATALAAATAARTLCSHFLSTLCVCSGSCEFQKARASHLDTLRFMLVSIRVKQFQQVLIISLNVPSSNQFQPGSSSCICVQARRLSSACSSVCNSVRSSVGSGVCISVCSRAGRRGYSSGCGRGF